MRELNSHFILSDSQLFLDHVLLTVTIGIAKENIDSFKFSIAKNSEEKSRFIKEAVHAIKIINNNDLANSLKLEEIIISFASRIDRTWKANFKMNQNYQIVQKLVE